jgi:hypothetical protein
MKLGFIQFFYYGLICYFYENNPRFFLRIILDITTAGVHRLRTTIFCIVTLNTYSSSVCNLLRVEIPLQIVLMPHLRLCKIFKSLNYTVWIRTNVSSGIIFRFCLLIDICFLYPIEYNIFTVCNFLFSTTCFCHWYLIKSGRIDSLLMANFTELDASFL